MQKNELLMKALELQKSAEAVIYTLQIAEGHTRTVPLSTLINGKNKKNSLTPTRELASMYVLYKS